MTRRTTAEAPGESHVPPSRPPDDAAVATTATPATDDDVAAADDADEDDVDDAAATGADAVAAEEEEEERGAVAASAASSASHSSGVSSAHSFTDVSIPHDAKIPPTRCRGVGERRIRCAEFREACRKGVMGDTRAWMHCGNTYR